MSDLIDRQAAIDEIKALYEWHEIVTEDRAIEHFKRLPSAQPGEDIRAMCGECDAWNQYKNYPQPGWIPCSERMPFVDEYGKSDQVLATCGLQGAEASSIRWLRILYFNGCNWCFPTGESYEQMVYAWMPLPKPWEGKEQ